MLDAQLIECYWLETLYQKTRWKMEIKRITQEDVDNAWDKARSMAWDKARNKAWGNAWDKARNKAWELEQKFKEQEELTEVEG